MSTEKTQQHSGANKEKTSGKKRVSRAKKSKRWLYSAAALGLAGLLVCAFLLPQVLFQVSDNVLCREIVLGERETVDVTLLSATYDPSLYNRMLTFAEGLASGVNYYVSEQSLEVDQDLYEKLWSETGIFQDSVLALIDMQLISGSFYSHFMVETWKQYVIYSDDYTKGVNFIIWYLEIVDDEEERLEILMDAETSTIYGVSAKKNHPVPENELDKWIRSFGTSDLSVRVEMTWRDLEDWWYFFCYYYEAINLTDVYEHYGVSTVIVDAATYEDLQREQEQALQETQRQLDDFEKSEWFGENILVFQLPYDGRPLELQLKLLPVEEEQSVYYRDMVFGIVPICRLIPEFEQNF